MDNILVRFFRQSVLSYKALFGFLDPKVYLTVKVVNPIMQLIFFTLLARFAYNASDVTPWVIGNAFLLSVYNSLFGVGMVMVSERHFGTLKLVIASTTNNFLIFIGRAFIHVFDASITVLIGLTIGFIFFGLDFSNTNFLMLILSILVTMFSSMGMGLFLGSIGLVARDLNLIMNTIFFTLMIFTGAIIPISSLPVLLSEVPYFLPITRGIEASKLIIDGQISSKIVELLLIEFFIGFCYLIIGYISLKLFERIARKSASLDVF
ncbi:hypothetical protein ABD76_09385 [Paenibacillus dendritiformis]|uniref:ABC transporter permease n=1 Tax=Paenibacillus dendritiformis TaxID=130049 RepID=UPI0018CEEDAB|nr:ABC transporter permease [Paenibacillus dendritiformis]MBG9792693.1 hypothetical protein [Paenibacillus dendritiformis]